jgi:hypothetical protein
MPHNCAKCNRKAKAGFRYCLSCEKSVRRAMAADGYLTDVTGLSYASGPAPPSERNRTYSGRHVESNRVTRDLPFRQLSGAMMKSAKGGKK